MDEYLTCLWNCWLLRFSWMVEVCLMAAESSAASWRLVCGGCIIDAGYTTRTNALQLSSLAFTRILTWLLDRFFFSYLARTIGPLSLRSAIMAATSGWLCSMARSYGVLFSCHQHTYTQKKSAFYLSQLYIIIQQVCAKVFLEPDTLWVTYKAVGWIFF